MPPSIPWLCLPRISSTTKNFHFYSLSEDKLYKIFIPGVENTNCHIVGSASGFLLIVDDRNASVLMTNPFTGTRARLPYGAQLPYGIRHTSCTAWDYSGSIVVGNYGCEGGAAYCRPAGKAWSRIKALANRSISRVNYKPCGFCIMDYRTSQVIILDSRTLDVTRIIQPPNNPYSKYSLLSRDDDIQFRSYYLNETGMCCSALFTTNPRLEDLTWSSITDIRNCTFFDNNRCGFVSKDSSSFQLRERIVYPYVPYENPCICYIYASHVDCFDRKRIGPLKCFSLNAFWMQPSFD